jgi:hypothetical protein
MEPVGITQELRQLFAIGDSQDMIGDKNKTGLARAEHCRRNETSGWPAFMTKQGQAAANVQMNISSLVVISGSRELYLTAELASYVW